MCADSADAQSDRKDVMLALQGLLAADDLEEVEEYIHSLEIDRFVKEAELEGLSEWGFDRNIKVEEGFSIKTGGAGIVFECLETDLNRKFALKIRRPSELQDEEKDQSKTVQEKTKASAEAAKSAQLSHPNVSYLWNAPRIVIPIDTDGKEGPVTVLFHDWVDNATPFEEYIYDNVDELDVFIKKLGEVFKGLEHIHEKGLVHWDIKAENCLMNEENGHLEISDMGNAQSIDYNNEIKTEEGSIKRFTTSICWPEHKRDELNKEKGSNRVLVEVEDGNEPMDKPWLDLYMAGRMIGRVCGLTSALDMDDEIDDDLRSDRARWVDEMFGEEDDYAQMVREALILICRRLLKPLESGGYSDCPTYYDSASEVESDLSKLLHHFGDAKGIKELYPVPQESIRAPVTDNIEYSERIENLCATVPAKRLMKHEQLGLTYFVYPGARHSRFEHMVGTIATTLEYIRALYADKNSPLFRLLCDAEHIRALLFAAIVHDFGHTAFSHYLEEREPLFRDCTHEDYIISVLFNDPHKFQGHDESGYTSDLRGTILDDREALEERVKSDGWVKSDGRFGNDPEGFLKLAGEILEPPEVSTEHDFRPDLTSKSDTELTTKYILHSIIDSILDADKLDYLRRDALHAGLEYPKGADVDRFLQNLTVALPYGRHGIDDPVRPTIAVNKEGVGPLESLLLSRYQVFKSMYWHRIARSATCLLKYLVFEYLSAHSSDIIEGDERKSNFEGQRDKLLNEFRVNNDQDSIKWLLEEVEQNVPDMSENKLEKFREALLRREGLPKPIFDISKGELDTREGVNETDENLVRIILAGHDALNDKSAEEFIRRWQDIIENTCSLLETRLEEIAKEDSHKKDQVDAPKLTPHNLFIDVPNPGKDQVRNLWVVDRENRLPTRNVHQEKLVPESQNTQSSIPPETGLNYYRFSQYSQIGEDVETAFRFWARRIRVFVWPEIHEEVMGIVNNNTSRLSNEVIECLSKAYQDELPESEIKEKMDSEGDILFSEYSMFE